MVWICMETAERTASSSLLNSSKQPQAPHLIMPMKILPMLFTSMPCADVQYRTQYITECCLHAMEGSSHLITVEDEDLSAKEPSESLY